METVRVGISDGEMAMHWPKTVQSHDLEDSKLVEIGDVAALLSNTSKVD